MGIDLGLERSLIPTCYTIRNRDSTRHCLMNWVFEASCNFKNWHVLDRRIHKTQDRNYNAMCERERMILEKSGSSTTWSIDQNYLKAAKNCQGWDGAFDGFRFFRIKQISSNSSGSDNLSLSGFEVYGNAYGSNWEFTA